MLVNQLTTLYGPNAQKVFVFNETFLKQEYSAVINFNDGNYCGILNIFKNVAIDAGYFTEQLCLRKDEFGIQRMSKKEKLYR